MKVKLSIYTVYKTAQQRTLLCYDKFMQVKWHVSIAPLIWMSLFLVIPFAIILKVGVSNSIFAMPPFSEVFSHIGDYAVNIKINFKNYVAILSDSYYISTFLNSVYFGMMSIVLCLLIGFPMAYGIHNIRSRLARMILMMLIAMSFWTSFLVRVYALINMVNVHGIINSLLLKFNIVHDPLQFIGNNYMICVGLVFCYLPFMIFPIYAILGKIDKSCIEASNDLGCSPTKSFWHIIIPLSRSGIVNGCVMVFAMSVGEFVIPELLGSSDVAVFGRVLWMEFFTNLNWPMACSLSVMMIVCIILPTVWFSKEMPSYISPPI